MSVRNILFLCTGNSARSILAEAIANKLGKGRFRAFSAGSHPNGRVNPDAIELLIDLGYETAKFRSKSWMEFSRPGAPALDIVITVCDSAAREACPIWPGHPMTAHWGMPDPAAVTGPRTRAAFVETYEILELRIQALLGLPIEELAPDELRRRMRAIGHYGAMAPIAL